MAGERDLRVIERLPTLGVELGDLLVANAEQLHGAGRRMDVHAEQRLGLGKKAEADGAEQMIAELPFSAEDVEQDLDGFGRVLVIDGDLGSGAMARRSRRGPEALSREDGGLRIGRISTLQLIGEDR